MLEHWQRTAGEEIVAINTILIDGIGYVAFCADRTVNCSDDYFATNLFKFFDKEKFFGAVEP